MKLYYLTFILAFLLSGCSLLNDPQDLCPDNGEGAGYITMSFKMITSGISQSRYDTDVNHGETDSDWPAFENKIDAGDLAFFFFVKAADNKWPLVLKVTDIKNSKDPTMMITGSPGAYTVTARISKQSLEEKNINITPGSSNNIDFRLVVIANTGNPQKFNSLDTTDFESLITSSSELTFDTSTIYKGTTTTSSISDIYDGAIPMFGIRSFSVTEDKLYYSRPEDRIWLGDISLLRSIAKIQVIDNIENRDAATGLPRIEKVEVQSRTQNLFILPADAAKYQNGYQIETANPCNGDMTSFRLGYLNPGQNKTTCFGYLPEQRIEYGYPEIRITVVFEVDGDGNPTVQQTFNVPMTGYKGQQFNKFGSSILRNHIYSISVDQVTEVEADFTVKVETWEDKELFIDYDQSVTSDGGIYWWPNSYYEKDDQTGIIIIKPWQYNEWDDLVWVPVEGDFTLLTPKGAKWTASLITTDGDPVFRFLTVQGETLTSISGYIDGFKSEFSIVSLENQPQQKNSAKLQIVVTLPDGTVLNVPDKFRYTIVQNPL